jgi:hypothetical protein
MRNYETVLKTKGSNDSPQEAAGTIKHYVRGKKSVDGWTYLVHFFDICEGIKNLFEMKIRGHTKDRKHY